MFFVPCCLLKFSFYIYLYPAPCFYLLFLACFFSPLTVEFFPVPCLFSVVLSCRSLLPPSPAPHLSYLFLHLSVPVFLRSLSTLLCLHRCPAPCPSLVCSILFSGSLSHTSSLCPSVLPPAFLFPFLPLSCCLWALSLVANSLLGFLMCLKE